MASNPNLNNLRREAIKRTQAATRKMARLRAKGVILTGSEFDLRKAPSDIRKLNTKQTESYIAKVNEFVNRRNQFVGLSEGAPVPLSEWKKFTAAQDSYNAKVDAHRAAFAEVFVPAKGMSVEEWHRKMNPDKGIFAIGKAAHRPLSPSESDRASIVDRAAMKTLQEDLKRKSQPEYLAQKIAEGREQMKMMLDAMGGTGIQEEADKLTDYQFNVLWSELDLAETISGMYFIITSSNRRSDAMIYDDKINDAKELLQWGQTIQESRK